MTAPTFTPSVVVAIRQPDKAGRDPVFKLDTKLSTGLGEHTSEGRGGRKFTSLYAVTPGPDGLPVHVPVTGKYYVPGAPATATRLTVDHATGKVTFEHGAAPASGNGAGGDIGATVAALAALGDPAPLAAYYVSALGMAKAAALKSAKAACAKAGA